MLVNSDPRNHQGVEMESGGIKSENLSLIQASTQEELHLNPDSSDLDPVTREISGRNVSQVSLRSGFAGSGINGE